MKRIVYAIWKPRSRRARYTTGICWSFGSLARSLHGTMGIASRRLVLLKSPSNERSRSTTDFYTTSCSNGPSMRDSGTSTLLLWRITFGFSILARGT